MATAIDVITSARYDLRDEEEKKYTNPMLLDFLNRGMKPLCVTLSSLDSDWVNNSTELSLTEDDTYVALPDLFISEINVKIGSDNLTKKSVPWIRNYRVDSSAGEPGYYAIQGENLLVEKKVDQDYTVLFEYAKSEAVLDIDDDMPFNDEFNEVLRQFIVFVASNRQEPELESKTESILLTEEVLRGFFYSALFSKLIARNYVHKKYKTDF